MHAGSVDESVAALACVAAEPLEVRDFAQGDAARWEAYVERAPEATFFHRIGWRTLIEEEFRHRTHYLVAERGGRMVGVLPLAQVRGSR